jgi:hypothetical protein
MTKQAFLQHIDNPFLLNETTLAEYKQLVGKYPFCSTLWLLYLKNLQLTNDIHFDEVLKRGAVACPDRTRLFALIHHKPEKLPEKETPLSATETPTIDQPVKTSPAENPPAQQSEPQNEPIPELEKQYLANAVNATILQEVSQLQNENDTPPTKDDNTSVAQEEQENTAENIPLGNRLHSGEQHSFDEWISLLNHKKAISSTPPRQQVRKKTSVDEFDALIQQFLQKEPKIVPQKKSFYSPTEMARLSVTENSEIVTETLALIYMQQGDYFKALSAYEKLSLKYPEKSSYFANQIKIIKQKLNKK